jgi:hypothetical protein
LCPSKCSIVWLKPTSACQFHIYYKFSFCSKIKTRVLSCEWRTSSKEMLVL